MRPLKQYTDETAALNEIKSYFNNGKPYFKGIYKGVEFCIRMNKDHAIKEWRRNPEVHNLSLVAVNDPALVYYKIENNKIQAQVDGVSGWVEAKPHIIEFLNKISE